MTQDEKQLRDKDIAVLQAIHNGASNVSEIREATTLTNREINYSINEYSLEQLGYVTVERSEGREWREIDGEKRYVWKPKTIHLNDKGLQKIAELDTDNRCEDMSRRELIEQVQQLEQRLDRLENVFKDFRSKVMKRI